jgi:hypothetical protein
MAQVSKANVWDAFATIVARIASAVTTVMLVVGAASAQAAATQ